MVPAKLDSQSSRMFAPFRPPHIQVHSWENSVSESMLGSVNDIHSPSARRPVSW